MIFIYAYTDKDKTAKRFYSLCNDSYIQIHQIKINHERLEAVYNTTRVLHIGANDVPVSWTMP